MKQLVFELFSILERWWIQKSIRPLEEKEVALISDTKTPSVLFLFWGSVNTFGGSGTALALVKKLKDYGIDVGVIVPSKSEKNISTFLKMSRKNVSFSGISSAQKVVLTNWQSYYGYTNILKKTKQKYMFVQDLEYLFFPYGSMHVFARQPYLDPSINKICLGEWLKTKMDVGQGSISTVPFPVTLVSEQDASVEKQSNEIKVLCYVKHSFRRAGALLLMQLMSLPKVIAGKKISVDVVGYSPTVLTKYTFPSHIHFKGFVSEDVLKQLINDSDVGVCYSLTNVSLFPFQYASLGKKCIDIEGGGAQIPELDGSVCLAKGSVDGLNQALERVIQSDAPTKPTLATIADTAKKFKAVIEA